MFLDQSRNILEKNEESCAQSIPAYWNDLVETKLRENKTS